MRKYQVYLFSNNLFSSEFKYSKIKKEIPCQSLEQFVGGRWKPSYGGDGSVVCGRPRGSKTKIVLLTDKLSDGQ